jgi:hypothetical protein
MAGAWSARVDTGDHLVAAGPLVLAGADHDQIARWVEVGRERVMTPRPQHLRARPALGA